MIIINEDLMYIDRKIKKFGSINVETLYEIIVLNIYVDIVKNFVFFYKSDRGNNSDDFFLYFDCCILFCLCQSKYQAKFYCNQTYFEMLHFKHYHGGILKMTTRKFQNYLPQIVSLKVMIFRWLWKPNKPRDPHIFCHNVGHSLRNMYTKTEKFGIIRYI